MSVRINVRASENKRTTILHCPSGTQINTAAPKDNFGDGSSFSPTDLVAAALASCMLTTVAIYCETKNITIGQMRAEIEKIMSESSPRRISKLPVELHFEAGTDEELRTRIKNVALSCPVHKSLDPQIEIDVKFLYDL